MKTKELEELGLTEEVIKKVFAMNGKDIEELAHVDKLHDLVTRKIAEHKATGAVIPEGMALIWNYEHEEIVKDVDDIKQKLSKTI